MTAASSSTYDAFKEKMAHVQLCQRGVFDRRASVITIRACIPDSHSCNGGGKLRKKILMLMESYSLVKWDKANGHDRSRPMPKMNDINQTNHNFTTSTVQLRLRVPESALLTLLFTTTQLRDVSAPRLFFKHHHRSGH